MSRVVIGTRRNKSGGLDMEYHDWRKRTDLRESVQSLEKRGFKTLVFDNTEKKKLLAWTTNA